VETESLFRSVGSKDRLVDRVVNNVQQLIVDGQLAPGDRLPPERELAEQIGVSRTVIREAVHILVARGLLESRQGVGTIVRRVTSDQISEPLALMLQTHELSIDQLHQVRTILEVGIVRLAAEFAMAEDIAELREIIALMEAAQDDLPAFVTLDDAFHLALVKTTHNPLLVILGESIGAIMHEVRLKVHQYTIIYRMAVPDHKAIVACIEQHDPGAAAQAMQVHLEHARRFQTEYLARQHELESTLVG
jgi:GntR family transcriptional repressor for pyruvate dehydrogenase complex